MKTFLQLNTIFLSMVMEAIPFILLGVLLSGFIQIFVTERFIARIMPKNRVLATLVGCGIGLFFPSCECGIVPITRRLMGKGMPLHAAVAFMLTGPVINPIVLFATYIAFGNDWRMVGIRGFTALGVAFCTAIILGYMFKKTPLRFPEESAAAIEASVAPVRRPWGMQIKDVLSHAVDEFFSVGKYLVLGAFIAAAMQTFIPTTTLLHMGSNPVTSSLVMIGLAFTMSLCSEADAFIASSFRTTFSTGALSAFLVYGPMIDIKNTLMLTAAFRGKFVAWLIGLVTVFTLIGSLIVGRLFG
ncbi:permease [Paenibacillus protaetiae]|uniref:Permease n=1 Tax=Paenibacillus protaetiae TaxID=2509456 RepID=A0A4P6F3D8_9BACL|nr:permease [Paenibacillus protaetiae]QAY67657.1 permease [Paenibacillus protaetiae]